MHVSYKCIQPWTQKYQISQCEPENESGIPEKCPTGCQVHGAALQTIREADDLRVGPRRQGQYASHRPHTQVDPDGLGAGPQAH